MRGMFWGGGDALEWGMLWNGGMLQGGDALGPQVCLKSSGVSMPYQGTHSRAGTGFAIIAALPPGWEAAGVSRVF